MSVCEFTVVGQPIPQGSLRSLVTPQGHVNTPQDGRLVKYRADLRTEGQRAMRDHKVTLMAWAVSVQVTFVLPRPKGHFMPINTRRDAPELRPDAPVFPMGPPDLDKLCRSVLDALSGIVYADDAQVIAMHAAKVFAEEPVFPGLTRIRITGGNGNG